MVPQFQPCWEKNPRIRNGADWCQQLPCSPIQREGLDVELVLEVVVLEVELFCSRGFGFEPNSDAHAVG